MLPVYICEDNTIQLKQIAKYVSDTIMIEELEMKLVLATSDPYEVLDKVELNGNTGIYFLDVDLSSDINGIELAEKIRKKDPRGYIVFITTHAEMSYLTFTYKIEALDYLIKDDFKDTPDRIKECLMNVKDKVKQVKMEGHNYFHVESQGKVIHIDYNKIIFFETGPSAHKVILHAEDRQLEFYGHIKEIEAMVDDRFVRCHRSYLINKDKIVEVDKKRRVALLRDGRECEVSMRGLKGFR